MVAPDNAQTGAFVNVYTDTTVITEVTEANLVASAVTGNLVGKRIGGSSLNMIRNYIPRPYTDVEVDDYLPAGRSIDDITINVDIIHNNTVHKALRDDVGTTRRSWIFVFTDPSDSTAKTYAHVEGYVQNCNVPIPARDEAVEATITIKPVTVITWVDAAD